MGWYDDTQGGGQVQRQCQGPASLPQGPLDLHHAALKNVWVPHS